MELSGKLHATTVLPAVKRSRYPLNKKLLGWGVPRAGLEIVENAEVSYPDGNYTAILWFSGLYLSHSAE